MDIRDLSTRQLANALVIFAAAIPFGADAVKAALMTAAAESSYLRYANDGSYNDQDREAIWRWYGDHFGGRGLSLDQCRVIYRAHLAQSLTFTHDAVAGSALTTKDSLGHYQQREMYGYGTVADLMDPAESTRIFLRGVPGDPTRVRHWSRTDKPKNLTIAQACQWVQGSEFPTGENYAPMEAVADQLIAHFGGLPQTKDWFNTMTASNWDEAKAELDASLATLKNQVASLYNDNVLTNDDGTPSGLPYGKQAAGFNDLRALIQRSGLMAVFKDNGTGWLYAVAPGVFRAFPEDIRELGAKGGLFTTAVVGASGDELVKLRDAVLMAERSPGDGIYAPDADGKVNFR